MANPLVSGEWARRASVAVDSIASDLVRELARSDGLESRRSGKANAFSGLFHAYADIAGTAANGLETCTWIMDHCLDLKASRRSLSLFGGWAGLGWMTSHLEADDDFVGTHVDQLIAARLPEWPRRQGYDLISGLVGVGVHFVERLPDERAKRGLDLVLDALETTAVQTDGGITWFTAPEFLPSWQRERAPNGYYNVGVAHGVPGVCWLLAKLCTARVEAARAESLLRRTFRWLRSCQPEPDRAELPSWIAPGVNREPNRRMAWCYGPLGASAVALEAAKAIGDRETEDWARTLALACAGVPPEEARIQDAGLCHGAAGNAQIFCRLAWNNEDAEFQEAADAWFRATLNHRKPGEGLGGYRMWGDVGDDRQGWVDDATFLTGSAGVGLALLAATTDIEPNWDRLLLLS